ncbi:MAG: hypothetical protein ABSF37_03380 [Sedimentisphaerales bacterium]|jgi:hypothetical protein
MSTEKSCILQNNAKSLQRVIIKGFMDEPTALQFVNNCGKSVTVLCRDGETQTNFACDVVYQYDEELYQKLKNAFDSNDKEQLMREWQCAKPIIIT